MIYRAYGIDIGNGYSKYKGGKFLSSIEVGHLGTDDDNVHYVNFRGVDYTVGSATGSLVIEENKYFSDSYLILLLTSIALTKGVGETNISAKVVVGLPPYQFNKKKTESLKKHLTGIKEKILVDGTEYKIYIHKVEIFIEGAFPLKENDDGKILIIDVGASIINVELWENQRIIHDYTFMESFHKLYFNMSSILNKQYEMKTHIQGVEQYVGVETIDIEGKITPVPEMKIMLNRFVMSCAGLIQSNPNFQSSTCDKLIIIGGGAEKTFPYLKKAFPHAESVEDSQHINQQVYEAVAFTLFEDEEKK